MNSSAVISVEPAFVDRAVDQAEGSFGEGELRAHEEYRDRPIDWIVEKLGVERRTLVWSLNDGYDDHRWDGTEDPLVAIADALVRWENVGVESGTGTGKSFILACLCYWFVACHHNSRVYSYAPKEDQLRLYMWTEMRKMWPRFKRLFPTAVLTDLRLRMDGESDKWGAVGYAVKIRSGEESATGAQGAHAPHMLLIVEETPGVDLSVMTALENTCTAPHNMRLAVGNPDSQHDALHQFCESPDVTHVRMSALDHPNVVTGDAELVHGAVSRIANARRALKYGEDGRLYKSRVRGISPPEAADALIKAIWCHGAVSRHSDPNFRLGPFSLGVDVANSEDGDRGAIARWQGACLLEVEAFACPDNVRLGLDVGVEIKAANIDPQRVGVDSVGVGAGTVNRLREMGYEVRALNSGAKPQGTIDWELRSLGGRGTLEAEKFNNLRSQMWWYLRRDLERGLIALPDDPELIQDLTAPTWRTFNGKIEVESKEKLRERLGRSPDKGDAVVYGNWVRWRRPIEEEPEPLPTEHYDSRFEEVVERLQGGRKRTKRGFS